MFKDQKILVPAIIIYVARDSNGNMGLEVIQEDKTSHCIAVRSLEEAISKAEKMLGIPDKVYELKV